MNIFFTVGKRPGKPFLLTIEDKSQWTEEQLANNDANVSDLVTGTHCTCTQQTYDALRETVGTLEAPALIANSAAQPIAGRTNVYVENNSLKILAQS